MIFVFAKRNGEHKGNIMLYVTKIYDVKRNMNIMQKFCCFSQQFRQMRQISNVEHRKVCFLSLKFHIDKHFALHSMISYCSFTLTETGKMVHILLILQTAGPEWCLQTFLNSQLLYILGSKQGYPLPPPWMKREHPLLLLPR